MSFISLYLYVPDEGSLLPKYRDCTTSNDFELYLMVIFKCYFSGELIALSLKKQNNGVNIKLGKTKRLNALSMMQIKK